MAEKAMLFFLEKNYLLMHDLLSPQSKQSPPGSFGLLTPIVKSQLI